MRYTIDQAMPTARVSTVSFAGSLTVLAAATCLAGACGGSSGTPDGPPPDTTGGCNGMRFTGELIDWDSDRSFCGIHNAVFKVAGRADQSVTAPNGRFDLCIPSQAQVLVDVVPPNGMSECTSPRGSYGWPVIAVASKAVIDADAQWSGRAFIDGRVVADPAKAQVHVHVRGTARAVSIGATYAVSEAVADTTWAIGDTGHEVFFRDVDVPAGGMTMLTVAGGAVGAGMIPLVAGKITSITVLTN